MKNKLKKWWRGFRLAFDPGYPMLTEFLPSVWEPTAYEKAVRMRYNAVVENLKLKNHGPVFDPKK